MRSVRISSKSNSIFLAIILVTAIFAQVNLGHSYGLLDDVVDEVSDTVSDTVDEVSDTVSDTVDEVSDTVSDTVDDVVEEVDSTTEDLSEELNDNLGSPDQINKKDVKNSKNKNNQLQIIKKEILSKIINYDTLLEIFDKKDIDSFKDSKLDQKINQITRSSNIEQDAFDQGLSFKSGKIRVVIELSNNNQDVLTKINKLIDPSIIVNNKLQVYVDSEQIQKLNKINGIKKIRPTFSAIQYDYPVSEGVYSLGADIFHSSGYLGKGVKIAVLDLSFDPNNPKISGKIVETKSFRKGIGDFSIPIEGIANDTAHGTAVAEIIGDVAPKAELFLYSIETDIEFEAAVDEAISKDIDIIVMSVGWPNFSTDGSSSITKKVEEAIENEIIFVVPAGNYAQKHWKGDFADINLNGYHDFVSGDEGLTVKIDQSRVDEKKPIMAYLRWDVGLNDVSDFDLVLVNSKGQIVEYSSSKQTTKTDDAFEYIHYIPQEAGQYALGIVYDGEINAQKDIPKAMIEIFMVNDIIEYPVKSGSVTVPTDADGAIVVGAVNHFDGEPEIFSSVGPTNDGKQVPHVFAPDGVTTLALGKPFYGTSATAPHIAGLAALIVEKKTEPLPIQILQEIQESKSVLYWLGDKFEKAIGYGKVNQATWQLVYIKENTCRLNDHHATESYNALVEEYFNVNQFENYGHKPICMSTMDYSNFQPDEDLDLLVLVYDEQIGNKNLRNNKLDGFYAHFGTDRLKNHSVVICDCSVYDSSYESTLPSWILSHELSHFILSYKGYHENDIRQIVHEIDSEYDNCVGQNFGDKNCDLSRLTISPASIPKDYVVMAPYNYSIGNYFVPYLNSVKSNSVLVESQREITLSWVKDTITDEEYITSLKKLASADKSTQDNINPAFNISDGFVIAEISKEKQKNWEEILMPDLFAQERLQMLIDNLSKKLVIKQTENEPKIPNWFKTRAMLWSEKKIGDAVFFDGVENLFRMGILELD